MLIELHYKICVADSWEDRFNKNFEVTTAVYDQKDSGKVEYVTKNLIEFRNGKAYFTIGLWPVLKNVLDAFSVKYTVKDGRDSNLKPKLSLKRVREFNSNLAKVIKSIQNSDSGIVCAPKQVDRHLIISVLCRLYKEFNILIVSPSLDAIHKLSARLESFVPGEFGYYTSEGTTSGTRRIMLATFDRAMRVDPCAVQLLLVDDCHYANYNTWGTRLMRFCFCRSFGFTARNIRNSSDYMKYVLVHGPVIKTVSASDPIQETSEIPEAFCMLPCPSSDRPIHGKPSDPGFVVQNIVRNEVRNKFLIDSVSKVLERHPDAQILVSICSLEHLIRLHQICPSLAFCHASEDESVLNLSNVFPNLDLAQYCLTKKYIADYKKKAMEGTAKLLLTTQIWEGIVLPKLSVIVRADGRYSAMNHNQVPERFGEALIPGGYGILLDVQEDCQQPVMSSRSEHRANDYQWLGKLQLPYDKEFRFLDTKVAE